MTVRRREFLATAGTLAIIPLASRSANGTIEEQPRTMYGLIGKMSAIPGQRDVLAAMLLESTQAMPGCLSYVIATDPADADALWITEVWDNAESHQASLKLPAVQAVIAKARPLIAGFSTRGNGSPRRSRLAEGVRAVVRTGVCFGWIGIAAIVGSALAACSRQHAPPQASTASTSATVTASANKRCVVLLHGKGQTAQSPRVAGDITYLRPGGNAEGWGGRQWLHFPDDRYREMRDIVATEIQRAGCGQVIVQGFSSGAAAAAKLYCRGERFDGRVKGYIIDDPVPDHGVDNCTPPSDVQVTVYWTGTLAVATDGWSCAPQDWTCEGGQTIGIEKYAQALRTEIQRSIHSTHTEYASPPEHTTWFAAPKAEH